MGDKFNVVENVEYYEDCPPSKSLARDMGNLNYTLLTALCEAIDNSVQSTADFENQRFISVSVDLDEGHFHIEDNGVGMTVDDVRRWATLGRGSHVDRPQEESNPNKFVKDKDTQFSTVVFSDVLPKSLSKSNPQIETPSVLHLENYLTSKLSRYGVGVKYSAAKLGKYFTAESVHVNEPTRIHGVKWNTVEEGWKVGLWTRLRTAQEVQNSPHYTKVCLSDSIESDEMSSSLLIPSGFEPKQYLDALKVSLARIYFFYIHGAAKLQTRVEELYTMRKGAYGMVKDTAMAALPIQRKPKVSYRLDESDMLKVTQPSYLGSNTAFSPVKFKMNHLDLSKIHTPQIDYIEHASSCFPLSFTITARHVKRDKDGGILQQKDTVVDVSGCIFYFPFQSGKESLPRSEMDLDDSNNLEGKSVPGMDYYWVGRLLPKASQSLSLPFMQPKDDLTTNDESDEDERDSAKSLSSRRKRKFDKVSQTPLYQYPDVPQRCFDRVRGFLFFPREFEVTQNKTEFIQSDPFFRQFIRLCDYTPFPSTNNISTSNTNVQNSLPFLYRKWLQECHKKLDHEVSFEGGIYDSQLNRTNYKSVTLGTQTITINDCVKYTDVNGNVLFGRVLGFFHEGLPNSSPTGSAVIQMWTYKNLNKQDVPSLSQNLEKLTDAEFNELVAKSATKVPVSITFLNNPPKGEINAGNGFDRISVAFKNRKGEPVLEQQKTPTDDVTATLKRMNVTLEIIGPITPNPKDTDKILFGKASRTPTGAYIFIKVGNDLEKKVFTKAGNYKLVFTADQFENNAPFSFSHEFVVLAGNPHTLSLTTPSTFVERISPGSFLPSVVVTLRDDYGNLVKFPIDKLRLGVQLQPSDGSKPFNLEFNHNINIAGDVTITALKIPETTLLIKHLLVFFYAPSKEIRLEEKLSIDVVAGSPTKIELSGVTRSSDPIPNKTSRFRNGEMLPSIRAKILDSRGNIVDTIGKYQLEVSGTCIKTPIKFTPSPSNHFEIERVNLESIFYRGSDSEDASSSSSSSTTTTTQSKKGESHRSGKRKNQSSQENEIPPSFVKPAFRHPKAAPDETDYLVLIKDGQDYHIGDCVYIGGKVTKNRMWIGKILRFYEDSKGMYVRTHWYIPKWEKTFDEHMVTDDKELILNNYAEYSGDNEVKEIVELCYIGSPSWYKTVGYLCKTDLALKSYYCEYEYVGGNDPIRKLTKFDDAIETLKFWLLDERNERVCCLNKHLNILPLPLPAFIKILGPQESDSCQCELEQESDEKKEPMRPYQIDVSNLAERNIALRGLTVEILDCWFERCQGSSVAGGFITCSWAPEKLIECQDDGTAMLPDLEYTPNPEKPNTLFAIAFSCGKNRASNEINISVVGTRPHTVQLTLKKESEEVPNNKQGVAQKVNPVFKCREDIAMVAKIYDSWGFLCHFRASEADSYPLEHPTFTIETSNLENNEVTKSSNFQVAPAGLFHQAHYEVTNYNLSDKSGAYRLKFCCSWHPKDDPVFKLEGIANFNLVSGSPQVVAFSSTYMIGPAEMRVPNGTEISDFSVRLFDGCHPGHLISNIPRRIRIESITPPNIISLGKESYKHYEFGNKPELRIPWKVMAVEPGEYKIKFRVDYKNTIHSKKINFDYDFTLIVSAGRLPSKIKWVKNIVDNVSNNNNPTFQAGNHLPSDISIQVTTENDEVVNDVNLTNLSLNLIQPLGKETPLFAQNAKKDQGIYTFDGRNFSPLTKVGNYILIAKYKYEFEMETAIATEKMSKEIQTPVTKFSVTPGAPSKLVLAPQHKAMILPTITLEGTLIHSLELAIEDDFQNIVSQLPHSLQNRNAVIKIIRNNSSSSSSGVRRLESVSSLLLVGRTTTKISDSGVIRFEDILLQPYDSHTHTSSGEYAVGIEVQGVESLGNVVLPFYYNDGKEMRERHNQLQECVKKLANFTHNEATLKNMLRDLENTKSSTKGNLLTCDGEIKSKEQQLPSVEEQYRIQDECKKLYEMNETPYTIQNQNVIKTVDMLRNHPRVEYVGILIELGTFVNKSLGELVSDMLGARANAVIVASDSHIRHVEERLKNVHFPLPDVLSLELIKKKPVAKVDADGKLDLPQFKAAGFLGYVVNMIYPSQIYPELRRTLWFHLLKDTVVFDTEANADRFQHECFAAKGRSPTILCLDPPKKFAADGFRKLGSRVSTGLSTFGTPPREQIVEIKKMAFLQENVNKLIELRELKKKLEIEYRKQDDNIRGILEQLRQLTDQKRDLEKEKYRLETQDKESRSNRSRHDSRR